MSTRLVYVVRGSEDGNIAAYTSARKAIRHALYYLSHCDGDPRVWVRESDDFTMVTKPAEYGTVRERLTSAGWAHLTAGSLEVEIEAFDANAPVPGGESA